MPKSQDAEQKLIASQIERTSHLLVTTADFAARRIFLYGAIDDSTAYRIAVVLSVMDSSPGDITFFLNTSGGNVENGYAIYDAIRSCKNPVKIVGFGAVMSMGAIVMQAGDLRLMAPSARLMIHTGNVTFDGDVDSDKLISMSGEVEGIRERFIATLVERSGRPYKTVRDLLVKETYFSAFEALQLGLIDGVLTLPEKPSAVVEPQKRRRR